MSRPWRRCRLCGEAHGPILCEAAWEIVDETRENERLRQEEQEEIARVRAGLLNPLGPEDLTGQA